MRAGSRGALPRDEARARRRRRRLVRAQRARLALARLRADGFSCNFEGKKRFPQLGINLNVLPRGASLGLYHRENHQEDFLVLSGRCVLVAGGEKRPLKAWDFVHCPGGTAHMIVGDGDEPAVVLAVGARGGRTGLRYLVDPVARELGVSVETETTKPAEAYAKFPWPTRTSYRDGWLPDL